MLRRNWHTCNSGETLRVAKNETRLFEVTLKRSNQQAKITSGRCLHFVGLLPNIRMS